MHPCYHPVGRARRFRWAMGLFAAWAVLEVMAEGWEWVRPRAHFVEGTRKVGW